MGPYTRWFFLVHLASEAESKGPQYIEKTHFFSLTQKRLLFFSTTSVIRHVLNVSSFDIS